jgi:hypothetical protein
MKFYHPQGHSFDTVPTNGENGNSSNVDVLGQPALDVSRPSAELSSTNFSQPHRNLRQNKTERPLSHEDVIENLSAMTLPAGSRSNLPPDVVRGHSLENPIRRGRGRGNIISIPNNLRETSLAETRLKRARRDEDEDDMEEIQFEAQAIVAPASVNKRGKLSCDQCSLRKIKVLCSPVHVGPTKLLVPSEGRRQASGPQFSVR